MSQAFEYPLTMNEIRELAGRFLAIGSGRGATDRRREILSALVDPECEMYTAMNFARFSAEIGNESEAAGLFHRTLEAMTDRRTPAPRRSRAMVIQGITYHAFPGGHNDPDIRRSYRLWKAGFPGVIHDVFEGRDGELVCDCPDFTFREDSDGQYLCKHVVSMVKAGLLSEPNVTLKPGG